VVERGTSRVAAGCLEDRADLPDGVWQLVVPPATERCGSAARRREPEQHPQGRGLAGPVGSEQGGHLAGSSDRADVIDREKVPEGLGEAFSSTARVMADPPTPPTPHQAAPQVA
jgi:hypothetical protein